MFRQDIEAVLTLFALDIVVDRKVLREEIETFMASAHELSRECGTEQRLSQTRLLYWFELNREALIAMTKLGKSDFHKTIDNLLMEVRKFPNRFLVLKILNKISRADGRIHASERALSKYAELKLADVA